MLKIGKDDVISDAETEIPEPVDIEKELALEEAKQNALVLKQVHLYGKQVVDKMTKENIPPTPANYAIYFEKLLEDKPQAQKQSISSILELEEVEDFDYVKKIESNISEGFSKIKPMMEVISSMYSKINKLRALTKAQKAELTRNSSSASLVTFSDDLTMISNSLTKQQTLLKEQYSNMASVIKNFNSESIFDKKYAVYNKKYLFKTIDSEKNNVVNFGYESTLLAFHIKEESLKDIRLTRDRDLIVKTVGQMVLKRSRRNDVVAHFQDGIFIIILKHTNTEQAKKAIESIEHMVSFSNYIVDSQSIDIKLDYAVSKILTDKTKEQIIATALDGLPS